MKSARRKSRRKQKTNFKIAYVTEQEKSLFIKNLKRVFKKRNMTFCDDIISNQKLPKVPNNIQKMPKYMTKVFKAFKQNSKNMIYAPLNLVKDKVQGYKVVSTNSIKQLTLISEYSGEIMKHGDVPSSDSIMDYYENFVIYPDKKGNIGKFLSGVNNKKTNKSKIQNVKSVKYNIEGKVHILLYASRLIKKDETLIYDYNAGKIKEYPTHNFI
jgi:hypothetical protein